MARVTCCWRPEQEVQNQEEGLNQRYQRDLSILSCSLEPFLGCWISRTPCLEQLISHKPNHQRFWSLLPFPQWIIVNYGEWDINYGIYPMAIDSLLISHKPTWWIMSSHSPSRQVHSGQPAEFYGLDALHQHPRCPNQSLGPDLKWGVGIWRSNMRWPRPGIGNPIWK